MVPRSRLSIPLIAMFVLVLASYLAYLAATKNIFQLHFVDHYFNTESRVDDSQESASGNSPWAAFFNRTDKTKTKATSTTAEKIVVTDDKPGNDRYRGKPDTPGSLIEPATDIEPVTDRQPVGVEQSDDTARSNSVATNTLTDSTDNLEIVHDSGSVGLWKKYSGRVQPLYSAPLDKSTEEKLGMVAQVSADLDQRYLDNKNDWINHLEEVRKDLIHVALEGEREGARALSFQYVRPPLNRTVEALTWAMIANAISPNDYYIYICSNEFSLCSESMFEQASSQAKSYVEIYNFVPKAPVPAK